MVESGILPIMTLREHRTMTDFSTPAHPPAINATAPSDRSSSLRYGALWRELPRGLGYLLPVIVTAILGFAAVVTLFSAGLGLALIWIGIPVLVACFETARFLAEWEIRRYNWVGLPRIARPHWRTIRSASPVRNLGNCVRDPHRWAALLHAMLIQPVLAILSWSVTITWVSVVLAGFSFGPINALFFGNSLKIFTPGDGSAVVNFIHRPEVGATVAALTALLFLLSMPYVIALLVRMHGGVNRAMLGRFASDDLRLEVEELESARRSAAAAQTQGLRRMERDIHDGPQQRLIRVQMDLAAAERSFEQSPERAAELIAEARAHTAEALGELRALSRGMAPPLLQDRGLIAELESLAQRAAVPMTLVNRMEAGAPIPAEVELGLYFVVSELVSNIVKHSRATAGTIIVDRASEGEAIRVEVTDNGVGGALALGGHGLAGLDDRVRGLGGTFLISSPATGPTRIITTVPAAR